MSLVFCLCKLIQRLLCSKHNYASIDNYAGQIFGDFYFNVFLGFSFEPLRLKNSLHVPALYVLDFYPWFPRQGLG